MKKTVALAALLFGAILFDGNARAHHSVEGWYGAATIGWIGPAATPTAACLASLPAFRAEQAAGGGQPQNFSNTLIQLQPNGASFICIWRTDGNLTGPYGEVSLHTSSNFPVVPYATPVNLGPCPCPAGNPINPAIGNKFQVETDYVGRGTYPLTFVRYYNSLGIDLREAGFSTGWTHTYSGRLVKDGANAVAVRANGRSLRFTFSAGAYVADTTASERLERITSPALGWRLTTSDDEVELYDDPGRLLSVSNRAGLTHTLAYGANGKLATVTDSFGRALSFARDSSLRIQSIATPDGAIAYAYSNTTSFNLVTVTYPGPAVRTYHYENATWPSKLAGITDENSERFSTYTYDATGRAISTEHAGGVEKVTVVNSSSTGTRNVAVKAFVDPGKSAERSYSYESIQSRASRTGVTASPGEPCPGCGPAAETYDANGNATVRTDWNGNVTNYAYDLARNLETSRTEAFGTPQARTISTQWHPMFRLPTAIAGPLRITTNTYDADGTACGARGALCSRSVQATTDANGSQGFSATASGAPRVWAYLYNANGSVLSVNGPRTDATDLTIYTYYANNDADPGKRGNVATITNGLGHTTSVTAYNAHGQPLTVVDPNGLTTTMTYDVRQRLTSRTVGSEATSYTYDGVGQLTRMTLPDSSFLEYDYDAAHRLVAMNDNLGNRIAYTLDGMGNRTAEQVFDPSNALAQTRSRVYNNLNRLFKELGAQGLVTEYAYDNQGNVVSVKDPLNKVTGNQYDALNRLKQVTDPGLGVTQYGYNGRDALVSVSDPRSLVTGYAVDGLGNLTQQVSPDTGATTSTYDDVGNLLTRTDSKGQTTTYAYDALNRVTLIIFQDGSKQEYAYDGGMNSIGRLTSITERDPANQQSYKTSYLYDQHGRPLSINTEHAGVIYNVGYSYDSAGRLTSLSYPSGRTVNYGFDGLGRVNQVTTTKNGETQAIVSQVAHQPFGGVKGFTFGNGQVYTRGIDLDGRTASYTLGAQSFGINYNAASRITMISDLANAANQNTYDYDSLDRLTGVFASNTNYAYAYDTVGNRISKTVGTSTEPYTYSTTSNRIATVGTRSFAFDANGSTTGDGNNTYAYDVRGRMVQATSSIGATSYKVNALGQRVRKTNSQADNVFHYDTNGRLIAESDPGGGVKRELIYLGDIPVGVFAGSAQGQSEIILDNGDTGFSVTGSWATSTSVSGFVGPNYQSHEANGAPPSAIVVDNGGPGFSVTGTWPVSTAVSGHSGPNYQVHAANGEPPSAILADNTSGVSTGTWPASTSVSGYVGTNYQVHPAGTGTSVFTWTLNVPSAATYQVYARWTQHPNRATNAKYTVNHASGAQVVTVNMEQGGGSWNLLGNFAFNAGNATISLSDDANDYVIADAVMLVPAGAAPNTATWTLAVPASGSYQVYARWTQHPNRATDAKYTVAHASGSTQITVNQEAGGGNWHPLGTFDFNSGNATVSLTDQANGYVIADAVMLVPPSAMPNTATWTPNVAQAGTYEVYARWTQHTNRATNATYTVIHASGSTAVAVNQQQSGGAWNLLGVFSLAPGSAHKVSLNDQANGFVIADAIRIVPITVQADAKLYFIHVDHLNTPRAIYDASQQLVWKWEQQEPFGVNVPDENPSSLGAFEFALRFPGQYFDKETNLSYNMSRDYWAEGGRYIESDPVGLSAGFNTYAYVLNAPVELVDPLGLAPCSGTWVRQHFVVPRIAQFASWSCRCYWLCIPCQGSSMWSGNPFDLPDTSGRTIVDHSGATSPSTGTGGGAAGAVRSNGAYRRGGGGGAMGGGYNCLCKKPDDGETGCPQSCKPGDYPNPADL